MINCLHHFEILTNSSEKLLNYFIKGFKFNLVNKINLDNRYTQYLINSNSINFLITSLETNNKNEFNTSSKPVKNIDSIYKSSLITIEEYDKNLYNVIKSKNNSAYNVSFKVRDLDRILFNCRKNNVKIIKDRHSIKENVDCAIIRSCIDGVAHTLFDLNNYDGSFLFDSEISNVKQNNLATHFDHLTYATYKDTSTNVIQWYKNIFNMKNIRINKEENAGLIVRTGKSGMNIRAMKYWLCAETGVELKQPINDHQNFKLVISEPLEDDPFNNESAKNQISIFLDENNGPGVQHIGFHTDNIVNSVRETKNNCDQVKYYVTPDSYYDNVEKNEEIKQCGLDVDLLKENHILLDAEIENKKNVDENQLASENKDNKSYLLQVFTQPIFDRNTLFLELIQRVGNAKGFGAANIKALWNAVQLKINDQNVNKLKKSN